eukprot:TRINITY_DN724_c0_g2_i1.p1 TRINITY_DN724_c0_g2~~TRINITY_DN724_c0_g2_i1.p1  ORF type:complete len:696 (-),score=147.31 TRINITY_DN724_c0_g2_i1:130-2217(-)
MSSSTTPCETVSGISIPKFIYLPGTDCGLDIMQESYLKKILLKLTVQDEVDQYFKNPSMIVSSMYLRFIYDYIIGMPLLNKEPRAIEKLRGFALTFPRYLSAGNLAAKRGKDSRRFRVFIAKIFEVMTRTPLERMRDTSGYVNENYSDILNQFDSEEEIEKELEKEKVRRAKLYQISLNMSKYAQAILADLEQEGSVGKLHKIAMKADKVTDLPLIYQNFVKYLAQAISVFMEKELTRDAGISKWKRFDKKMPTRTIKMILSTQNTSKLVQGLLQIFTARPFGAKSLLMKQASTMVELKRTLTLAREKKRLAINELKRFAWRFQVFKIFEGVIDNAGFGDHIVETGTEDTNVTTRVFNEKLLRQTLISNGLAKENADALTSQDLSILGEWIVLEVRLKEKQDFVDIIGSEEMVGIIRELLPVIYDPIISVFVKANAGSHFGKMFQLVRRMVEVGEKIKQEKIEDQEVRTSMLHEVLDIFTQDLWDFLHALAKADDEKGEVLQSSLKWYVQMLQFVHRREALDVQSLLLSVDETTKANIIKEVDGEIEYMKYVMKMDCINKENREKEKEHEGKGKGKSKSHSPEHISDPSSSLPHTTEQTDQEKLFSSPPQRPALVHSRVLVPAFLELMRDRLCPKEIPPSIPNTHTTSTSTTETFVECTTTTTETTTILSDSKVVFSGTIIESETIIAAPGTPQI